MRQPGDVGAQAGVGEAVEVGLALEARPLAEQGQGDDLAAIQGGGGAGARGHRQGGAVRVDLHVQCGQEGLQIHGVAPVGHDGLSQPSLTSGDLPDYFTPSVELSRGMAMTRLAMARVLDGRDQPVDAARAYEAALTAREADLLAYLDLAVLYFVCNDGGYAAYHSMSREFLTVAWNRMCAVLDEARIMFGADGSIVFWKRYFQHFWLQEQFTFEECRELAESSVFLDPYLYLYISTADRAIRSQQREKAEELFLSVREGRTSRERYIRSVLESAFRHTEQLGE